MIKSRERRLRVVLFKTGMIALLLGTSSVCAAVANLSQLVA